MDRYITMTDLYTFLQERKSLMQFQPLDPLLYEFDMFIASVTTFDRYWLRLQKFSGTRLRVAHYLLAEVQQDGASIMDQLQHLLLRGEDAVRRAKTDADGNFVRKLEPSKAAHAFVYYLFIDSDESSNFIAAVDHWTRTVDIHGL